MTLAPLLMALVLTAPPPQPNPSPTSPTPAAPRALWEVSAFARFVHDALAPLPDVELMGMVEHLRGRLFLDDMTTVIETGTELELAMRFATGGAWRVELDLNPAH